MGSVVVDSAAVPGPQYVAKGFADQYYYVLLNNPAEAYKYYVDSSVVSWPGSDGKSAVTVTTVEKIHDLIMSRDYEGCQALVETIDGQASQSGGIVVVVTGTWKGKDTARSFSETFFLAKSGGVGGYHVLNDVFRFVGHHEPPSPAVATAGLVQTAGNTVVSAPAKGDQAASKAAAETRPKKTTEQEVINKVETLAEKISHASLAEKKAAVAPAANPRATQVAAAHKVVVPAVANPRANQVAAAHKVVVPAATTKPKNDNNNNNNNNNNNGSSSPQDNGVDVNGKSVAPNNNKKKTVEELEQEAARTIFIGNLPSGVSVYEVRDVVKRSFGRIARGGVRVRWNEDETGYRYWFGFVEFESAASASYAIRMGKIFFGQREAYVTQRGLPGFPYPQQVVQKKKTHRGSGTSSAP